MGDYIVSIKKAEVLSELERSPARPDNAESANQIIKLFESLSDTEKDELASRHFFKMWEVALVAGKINLANKYAQKALHYLIEHKRIPQIKIFLQNLHSQGLFKNKFKNYSSVESILLGKKEKNVPLDLQWMDLYSTHPEHWNDRTEFLKNYLLMETEWTQEQWKLCYEYILNFHFDKDLFMALFNRAAEQNNAEVIKDFASLFASKKIKTPSLRKAIENAPHQAAEKLNLDYDQLAMEVISGTKEADEQEQKRVISSLKYLSEEELHSKSKEMIVAFELLGMDLVVIEICEKIIKSLTAAKERASVYFSWCQALINSGESYGALRLLDEVLRGEPLLGEELLAFWYLKAEVCYKLKKLDVAKALYSDIKKQNPHYRLVGERLKALEKIK